MNIAVEHLASEPLTGITSYTSTIWNGGTLIKQRTDIGITFIGPMVGVIGRPVEQSAAIPGIFPVAISWSSTIDWLFLADNATAGNTRRIEAYTFNRTTGSLGWLGFITLTYSTATAHTIRGFRVTNDAYTTGTVGVTGTTVVGNSTLWVTNRMCAGCRIGFGTTDPTQVATWYAINTITGEGAITLTGSILSTLTPGQSYVIEDLRCYTLTTNATTTNGGVYVTKGININLFTPAGTTISAAVATDLVRGVYWLADASTETNIVGCGCDIDAKTNWTTQTLYSLDGPSAGNYHVYQYNVRKALTLSSGKDYTTLISQTGTEPVTGTISQNQNFRLATLNHGPANGNKALYFVTTTRIYCTKVASLSPGSTTYIDYTMTEVPPGGTNTFLATGALTTLDYDSTIDRLVIISSGAAGDRSYVTQFNNSGNPIDQIFLTNDLQIDQGNSALSEITPHPTPLNVIQTVGVLNGLYYFAGIGTTQATNMLHIVPCGADWQYASTTNQRLITPAFSTPNCNSFLRVYVIQDELLGDSFLGKNPDPYRIYYRTANINVDAVTGWIQLTDGNSLASIGAATQIQFMLDFKCISDFCIPGRIFSIGVVYSDLNTDSHYQPSANYSNITTGMFAWRFSTAWGQTVPALRIRLYDAILNTLLIDDNTTASASGTWQKTTNAGTIAFGAYNSLDQTNQTTYIAYTPTTLGSGITIKALLTTL
jgi:hypothetical protein